MAQLVQNAPLEEAATDLKRWEHKVDTAEHWVEKALSTMQWEGVGAREFTQRAVARKARLKDAIEQLHALRVELEALHKELPARRKAIADAEEHYAFLAKQGQLLPTVAGKPQPPHGDDYWPRFLLGLPPEQS